ncbi:unnamed protein product [Cladocopium goreaui]|uniref:Nucleotide-diphospho-sugar transferase domain-containing protein n=1 Tax=Cladocopium goreaui TaxID=2562237 RepID=A0A9P1GRR7_9DINO|nr:unnamed protein product [Cladocopium goreaui]
MPRARMVQMNTGAAQRHVVAQRRSLQLHPAGGGSMHTAPATRNGSPRPMAGWEVPSFAKAPPPTSPQGLGPAPGRAMSAEGVRPGVASFVARGSPQQNHHLGVVEEDGQVLLERASTADPPVTGQAWNASRSPSAHTRAMRGGAMIGQPQPQPSQPPPPPPPPPQPQPVQQGQQAPRKSDGGKRLSASTPSSQPMSTAISSDSDMVSGAWVESLLKKSLLEGITTRSSSTNPSLPAAPHDLHQELRILRQEIKMEVEARKQMGLQIEAVVQAERKKREEALRQQQQQNEQADSRLEERWHTTVKEESALRRAVESHIEARLVAMQREVRLEVGSASTQTQQVLSEFGHFRDSIRQELDMQKMEISSASADLSRLVDQLRVQTRGDAVAIPNAESITDTLVRAEVRRQLSERSSEISSQGNVATAPALQAATSRLDLLEKALETECSSRQEESSQLLATFHELIAGGRRRQEEALQELEKRVQAQLEAAKAEVQQMQQDLSDERQQRQNKLQEEAKEREETCLMILKTLEGKMATERQVMEEKIASMQLSAQDTSREELEKQLQSSVASYVERSSKDLTIGGSNGWSNGWSNELMTTRQDLLELREELQEVSRTAKENLEPRHRDWEERRSVAVHASQLGAPGTPGAPGSLRPEEMAVSRLSSANLAVAVGKSDRPEAPKGLLWVGDVQRLIDGQTKLREELWNDVDRVRNELRMETASRKEDVQGVRSSLDRLREQVVLGHPSPSGTAGSGIMPATDDVRAALAAERMAREQGDERCLEEMRDMVREERQKREKEYSTLELRMQSEEQTLFVESGKREERDRDILSQISTVSEDLDAVKRQLTNASQQRHQLEELQKSQVILVPQKRQGPFFNSAAMLPMHDEDAIKNRLARFADAPATRSNWQI